YPSKTEHQGFQFGLREHQGWQHEARPQYVTDTRLTLDARALGLERPNVSVQGANTDAELLGQSCPTHGALVAPEDLQERQQSFGSRHSELILPFFGSSVTYICPTTSQQDNFRWHFPT